MSRLNVSETLKRIKYDSLEDIINALYDKLKLSFAIFDADGILVSMCMKADRCKCYYMLLHGHPNQCSIFNSDFVKAVLAEKEVDKLCDYSCRLTSRELEVGGKMYKFIMFQYNLDDESLEFNPNNDINFTEIHKGDDTSAVNYSWIPNVITHQDREDIFKFVRDASEKFLVVN